MSLSASSIGTKLRAAREATAMSTRAAARETTRRGIRVSHATLANYERGDTMPTVPTLRLLADIYECPIDHILGDTPTLVNTRYRALKSVLVRDRRQYEGEATKWVYLYFELEALLDRVPKGRGLRAKPDEAGPALAARVREHENLGDKPIPSVIRLLETYGVRVVQVRSEARIDGLSAMFGSLPVVALNPVVPNDRFRFNAAHELGHHLFDDTSSPAEKPHDDDDHAHEFASHLLMPDSVLGHAMKGFSMVRLVRYKELYGISLAAMIYRARQRDLLSQSDYQRVWREFARLGWRKREPGFVAPDYSSRLEQLIEEAVSKKQMSYGQIARFAAIDEGVLRSRVLEAIGGRLQPEHELPSPLNLKGRG